jgi:DNA repair ATPase RecN
MNASDRRKIAKLAKTAQNTLGVLEDLRSAIEEMVSDEESKYDNMCERGLESSPMGEAIEEAMNALEEAFAEVDEAHTNLESAITTMEELQ